MRQRAPSQREFARVQPVACSGSNASSEVALLLVVPSAHAVGAAAGSARAGEAGAASPVCAQTREGLAGRDLFATDEERVAGVDAEARGARWRRLADAMSVAGSVAEIWRYPVKSMGGERLAQSAIAARGLHADRMWAVRDAELDTFTTARRWPVLLQCSARFAENPADRSAGPGDVLDVIVTFPDGSEVSSSDPVIHDRLSELVGKPARLESLPALSEKRRYRAAQATKADMRRQFTIPDGEPLPDFSMFPVRKLAELARYATPVGALYDAYPILLLTRAEPARGGRALARFAVRRPPLQA